MIKYCDNTSVALVVRDAHDRVLLIERKQYNPGYALPAGHQDGPSPEEAARKELFEEVGLTAGKMEEILTIRLQNPCIMEGGDHHMWTIFEVLGWHGQIRISEEEVKNYMWVNSAQIRTLADRFERFVVVSGLRFDDLPAIVYATNESDEWKARPGLEPPMYFIFKKLGII